MKVTVITAVYNGEKYIESCIKSILAQDHENIEYIVVDGASTDRTLEIVRKYQTPKFKIISGKDLNLYDAMNKGLALATGDVVGILNSDDFYKSNDVISSVVQSFEKSDVGVVIGDLEFVEPESADRVVRVASPKKFKLNKFLLGDAPPHPAFFVKRSVYEKYGVFNINYAVCADFDLMLRFLYIHKVKWVYLPKRLVSMRMGGITNRGILDKLKFNKEKLAICRSHGLKTNMLNMYSRYLYKVFELKDNNS